MVGAVAVLHPSRVRRRFGTSDCPSLTQRRMGEDELQLSIETEQPSKRSLDGVFDNANSAF